MQFARIYRNYKNTSEHKFNISIKESDIYIISDKDIKKNAYLELLKARQIIEAHIKKYPDFFSSLKPLKIPENNISVLLKNMYIAGKRAKVGPFASVAGAIAEYIGRNLKKFCNEIIIENGGDIFIDTKKDRFIKIYSNNVKNLGLKILKEDQPLSVCSSSSIIGHSKSFGKAELVVVIAKNGAIADAFATSICNKIKKNEDLQIVLNGVKDKDIVGIVAIINGKIAFKGNLEFVKIGA